jgi:hypothetical protein
MEERIKIQVETISGNPTSGEIMITKLSKNQRMKTAFKKLFFFGGIAIFSVFLPVLHFFLVPLFLILGIVFGVKSYRVDSCLVSGNGSCPHCKEGINFKSNDLVWPILVKCHKCSRDLNISMATYN